MRACGDFSLFHRHFITLQVIAINDKFPGPTINVTTNYNVVINVRNKLDESLLITWYGFVCKV